MTTTLMKEKQQKNGKDNNATRVSDVSINFRRSNRGNKFAERGPLSFFELNTEDFRLNY